ncbi:MAG: ATP-binding protein [Deltaproteobacteria bacterium]
MLKGTALNYEAFAREGLQSSNDELSRRTERLQELSAGLLKIIKDLERSEHALDSAYVRLKKSQTQLIQASKLKAMGELAASVAHELNQPITVVKGLCQNMMRTMGTDSSEIHKLKLIGEACAKMEAITRHLKSFARPDQGEFRPIDINAVINESLVVIRGLAKGRGIKLTVALNDLPLVRGSANRLEQVLLNLVQNAMYAINADGEIRISTGKTVVNNRTFACLSVSDTGPGIPREIAEKIFEPFFTTKKDSGTGLGLSISMGIIKEHSGEIIVESAPPNGATFLIRIPALPTADTPGGIA